MHNVSKNSVHELKLQAQRFAVKQNESLFDNYDLQLAVRDTIRRDEEMAACISNWQQIVAFFNYSAKRYDAFKSTRGNAT